jgi:hypothetical protein
MKIIDSTSGNEIKGRIDRFVVTSYRRGEGMEHGTPGVFTGVRSPKVGDLDIGKRALIAALESAEAHNADRTMSFYRVVSLYDKGMKTWWPCHLAE